MYENTLLFLYTLLNEFEHSLEVLCYVFLPMIPYRYIKIAEIFRMIDFKLFTCHHDTFDTETNKKCFVVGNILIADVNTVDDLLNI